MVSYRILVLAGLAAGLPLNINLGAYSPALVVGKSRFRRNDSVFWQVQDN